MSVLIKGMKMPSSCNFCIMLDEDDKNFCYAELKAVTDIYDDRPTWCPLVEVKPTHKCGECIHLCGKRTTVGIECMEPSLQWKWKGKYYRHGTARYKYPSRRACKRFQPKVVAEGETDGRD